MEQNDCMLVDIEWDSLAASVYDIECDVIANSCENSELHVNSLAASVYNHEFECQTGAVDSPNDHHDVTRSEQDQRGGVHLVNDTTDSSNSTGFLTYDCNQVRKELSTITSLVFKPEHVHDEAVVSSNGIFIDQACPWEIRLKEPAILGGVSGQLKPDVWKYYLEYEDDLVIKDYLWQGVSKGFAIVDEGANIESYECTNYNSCTSGDAFAYIDVLIRNEISSGKFVVASERPHCVHALGAIQKSNGSYRPITDCRRPMFRSINNYMDTTFEPFSYASTDRVCDLMTQGCYMATVDIASAYRTVSIKPEQWKFQGIAWPVDGELTYLYDVRLSFGLRCAPFIFTQLSDFVVRTMERMGYHNVISYLDDFILVEQTRQRCVQAQTVLFELLGALGFQVAWEKCTAPSTKVRYLGIDFDSVQMTLALPEDKVLKLCDELRFFENKTKATKRQLQRLCGILSHASKVIRGGRVFSRRIIDLLKDLPSGNQRVRLNQDFSLDMEWWKQYSASFNGKAKLIHSNFGDGPVVFSDACLQGYGFVCGDQWQAGAFVKDCIPVDVESLDYGHVHWVNVTVLDDTSINYLELVAIYLALYRFAESWRNQHVLCFTDNTQAMAALNRGTSVSKNSMSVIRQIFWICANNNIYLSARHVAGEKNLMADWLSRACIRGSLSIDNLPICCSVSGAVGHRSVSSG